MRTPDPNRPPEHLVSAARALERILASKHPGHVWTVTVRDEAAPDYEREGGY